MNDVNAMIRKNILLIFIVLLPLALFLMVMIQLIGDNKF
jgi:hypothetical protein